jgi:hypothetical protein
MLNPITGNHPFVEDVAKLLGLPWVDLERFEIHFGFDEVVVATARVVLDESQVAGLSRLVVKHRISALEVPDGPTPQADRLEDPGGSPALPDQ